MYVSVIWLYGNARQMGMNWKKNCTLWILKYSLPPNNKMTS